jgi:carboxymethylenebutenolidase
MSDHPPIPPSGNADDFFRNYMIDEFVGEYQERHMTRRDALKRLAGLFGSMALASTFLAACAPPPPTPAPPTAAPVAANTSAPTAVPPTVVPPTTAPTAVPATATAAASATPATLSVAENDSAIDALAVTFPGQGTTIMGYLAKPKGNGPFPIVLVCHENRGLTDHIKDVTRRYGKAGFVALSVDLLSRQGGTSKVDPTQVPGLLGNTADPNQFVSDFKSGLEYAQTLAYARKDRAGMVGYCFGGGVTWRAVMAIPELRAAAPYYGPIPPLTDAAKINAAVLAFYGETDTFVNPGIPNAETAMKQNNKTYEKMIYPGAGHAFNNDTGASYNAAATRDAFARSVAWFEKYLKS